MEAQEDSGSDPFEWVQGPNITCRIFNDQDGPDIEFVPDMTVLNEGNNPVVIIEVSFSHTKVYVTKKIQERLSASPSIVGAVVINFEESPTYRKPKHDPAAHDTLPESEWKSLVAKATGSGPIEVKGNVWCGAITCSFDIWLAGDTEPRVTQNVCCSVQLISISNP